jgi:hypothetical protein
MAERKPFLLRINPELWEALEAWAKDEFRSVNGQIEYILRDAVGRRKGDREQGQGPAPGQGSKDRPAQ